MANSHKTGCILLLLFSRSFCIKRSKQERRTIVMCFLCTEKCIPCCCVKVHFIHELGLIWNQKILVLGPRRSSARFWLELLGKKNSARLTIPSKKLGSAWLAISCNESLVQLGLLYHLKNRVTLKRKCANIQHFCQFFLGIILRTSIKVCFSTKKLYSLKKSTENSKK